MAADVASADETYIGTKRLIDQADGLKANGNPGAAKAKYEQAQKALKSFATKFPGWNTRMVNYRLEEVTAKLNEMQQPAPVASEAKDSATNAPAPKARVAAPEPKAPPALLRPPAKPPEGKQ